MPAVAPGYGARTVHVTVLGSKNDRGRTWTVARIVVPAAVTTARASVPVAAESGTTAVIVNDVHAESVTAASIVPPLIFVSSTVPRAVPKPRPSITNRSPRVRIGSMAPAT